jgi:SulP family sulfate permease
MAIPPRDPRLAVAHLGDVNPITLLIGVAATAFLFWVRKGLKPLLIARAGPKGRRHRAKAGPVAAVVVTRFGLGLRARGPGRGHRGRGAASLPPLTMPGLRADLCRRSVHAGDPDLDHRLRGIVSVAQTLAAKKRQRIDPDQELIGLGAANIGAAFTGGYPVTGGFARSVVNFDAGAETPAAGAFTAVGLAIAALALTPLIFFLPKATLAATIIVAVLSLVDFSILTKTWTYSKADFVAVAATILLTLGLGVEIGVSAGVMSVDRPASLQDVAPACGRGRPGPRHPAFPQHQLRHEVETDPEVVTLRIDESLYFANARFLEDLVQDRVTEDGPVKHVVLMCSAVNEIDISALESLEAINARLRPVMGVACTCPR